MFSRLFRVADVLDGLRGKTITLRHSKIQLHRTQLMWEINIYLCNDLDEWSYRMYSFVIFHFGRNYVNVDYFASLSF